MLLPSVKCKSTDPSLEMISITDIMAIMVDIVSILVHNSCGNPVAM
jgi:hypothetical protein